MTQPIEPAAGSSASTGGAGSPGSSTTIRPERQSQGAASPPQQGEEDWQAAARKAGAPLAAFEPSDETAEQRDEARSVTNDPEKGAERAEENYIYVESGLETDSVALYERAPEHPDGEIFVGPGDVVKVFKTGPVNARLATGELVEVDEARYNEVQQAREEAAAKAAEKE